MKEKKGRVKIDLNDSGELPDRDVFRSRARRLPHAPVFLSKEVGEDKEPQAVPETTNLTKKFSALNKNRFFHIIKKR